MCGAHQCGTRRRAGRAASPGPAAENDPGPAGSSRARECGPGPARSRRAGETHQPPRGASTGRHAVPAPSEATPAPALRPGLSTGTSATTEASVRALLEAARRDLARITPGGLTTDARTQFEAASRFAEQADAALKARNLVYAGLLADKAATLAAALLR